MQSHSSMSVRQKAIFAAQSQLERRGCVCLLQQTHCLHSDLLPDGQIRPIFRDWSAFCTFSPRIKIQLILITNGHLGFFFVVALIVFCKSAKSLFTLITGFIFRIVLKMYPLLFICCIVCVVYLHILPIFSGCPLFVYLIIFLSIEINVAELK